MRGAWLFALLSLSACSWLIDPENSAPRCALGDAGNDPCAKGFACVKGACIAKCVVIDGEPDPCPKGESCTDGVCTAACVKTTEICKDNIDNDCDGNTDEQDVEGRDRCGDNEDNDCDGNIDEGHDQDGDKNQWCGDITMPQGDRFGDCDDMRPDVYYQAPELCDGIDNDCDDITDETTGDKSLCSESEECLGQRCVVPTCAIPGSSKECSDTEMCDVVSGKCVPKGCDASVCNKPGEYCDQTSGECRTERRDNGEPCAAHSDCKSASCIESAALRLSVASERVCGQTCCLDSDCGEGERCFTAGTGARSCLPVTKVPVPDGAAALCTLDKQCAEGQACGVEERQSIAGSIVFPRNDLTTTVCRNVGTGEAGPGESCGFGADQDCASRACIQGSGGIFFPSFLCSQTCRTSSDCEAVADSSSNVARRPSYCRFGAAATGAGGADYVPICVIAGSEIGTGSLGSPCSSGTDCKDGACVGATPEVDGFCAPTCCNDAQCGSLGEVRTLCRPVAFGGDHYETRCVP